MAFTVSDEFVAEHNRTGREERPTRGDSGPGVV